MTRAIEILSQGENAIRKIIVKVDPTKIGMSFRYESEE
jgi:hypothetical protein